MKMIMKSIISVISKTILLIQLLSSVCLEKFVLNACFFLSSQAHDVITEENILPQSTCRRRTEEQCL